MYDFAIQASNPTVMSATGQRVKTLASAIPAIFPVTTEEAYMVWNWVPVRISYKYDLYVLIDDIPYTVRREDVLSRCGWSPFEGTTFHSRIAATWVNGTLAWDGSALVGDPAGQRLQFDR